MLLLQMTTLPSLVPWTPHTHHTFPDVFKVAAYTIIMCSARTDTFPEALVFKLLSMLVSTDFNKRSGRRGGGARSATYKECFAN
jgi:hypothetical protein